MLLKLSTTLFGLAAAAAATQTFHPSIYEKTIARCPAINNATGAHVTLDISYVDINPFAKTTLLLVHGWPGLWSTWSNQILEFGDSYHLLVPDNRGFGGSSHPQDIQSSGTMGEIVGDLVCVLEHARVQNAVCVGHDWGSQVCYEAARMRPDLFEGVVGVSVPYIPSAGNFTPIDQLADALPTFAYQVYFADETDKAIAELNTDIRRTLRATYKTISSPPPPGFLTSKDSFLSAYHGAIPPSPILTREEEDYLVQQYSRQGFKYTLEFYTVNNRFNTFEFDHLQGNLTIPRPVLAIYPTQDIVANWSALADALKSATFLPELTTELVTSEHWPQREIPNEFNRILRSWLKKTFSHGGPHRRV